MTKAQQEHSIEDKTNPQELGQLFSFKDKKAFYCKKYNAWNKIERANQPNHPTKNTKYLSSLARDVLAIVVQKLEKSEKVFFNHAYLSKITGRERKQNQRIIHQLSGIIDITYHNSVTYKGKKYRHSYEFCHKKQTQDEQRIEGDAIETFCSPKSDLLYIYKNKDIDLQSNFLKNSGKNGAEINSDSPQERTEQKLTAQTQSELSTDASKLKKKFESPKKLADFYPINQEDCLELQNRSGRDFNLNAMNEILLDMSKRRNDPYFHSKKGFISYMSKAFAYEKRDAVKTNNENFKIKANLSPVEKQEEEAEKFLTEIEYSKQISPEWHFKKKLASALERKKAYELLKAYKRIVIEDNTAKLILHKAIELTPRECETVLSQVKATHERYEGGEYCYIDKVEFIITKSKNQISTVRNVSEIPNNLWGAIRHRLIDIYGQAMDGHWFSKLEALVDEENKTVEIKTPNSFFKRYIEDNFLCKIEDIVGEMDFSMRGVTC